MKEYTMSKYATKEDLSADMRKDIESLRQENAEKNKRIAEITAQRDGLQIAIDDLLCEKHRTCGEISAHHQDGCLICRTADLEARVEELAEALEFYRRSDAEDDYRVADKALSLPTIGAPTRLRDKHYRECEDIILAQKWYLIDAPKHQIQDCVILRDDAIEAIARAREGK